MDESCPFRVGTSEVLVLDIALASCVGLRPGVLCGSWSTEEVSVLFVLSPRAARSIETAGRGVSGSLYTSGTELVTASRNKVSKSSSMSLDVAFFQEDDETLGRVT